MKQPKVITIWLDENERYTIAVDAVIKYECLASDEVAAIITELMEGNEQ